MSDIITRPRLFDSYQCIPGAYDEFFSPDGTPRANIKPIIDSLNNLGSRQFQNSQRLANMSFLNGGITFTVYSDKRGTEKIFPFDIIPRIIPMTDWELLVAGLRQRVLALNAFLADIYNKQYILKDKIIPAEQVFATSGYLPEVQGITPLNGVYIHISGIDIIRDTQGNYVVLEDNIRTPSGVSYVLENRLVMKRVFPNLLSRSNINPVDEYPLQLASSLASVLPGELSAGWAVVLSPGPYNSAYFEHSFLARKMGYDLVTGDDLFVHDNKVYLKATCGPQLVSIIYRRIDDDFLDPEVFREDSLLGVPGLMKAYAAGNVVLANAVGNGVADDKAIYPYVPDMIRYYLSEDPLLPQVETYLCHRRNERDYVLKNLDKLVIKETSASGGYGMMIGTQATKRVKQIFAERINANPDNYIAQPLVELSTCPTYINQKVVPRRIDFRPYILQGSDIWVLPGGLSRVALEENSYIVNSSQGGGSKDTWVVEFMQ